MWKVSHPFPSFAQVVPTSSTGETNSRFSSTKYYSWEMWPAQDLPVWWACGTGQPLWLACLERWAPAPGEQEVATRQHYPWGQEYYQSPRAEPGARHGSRCQMRATGGWGGVSCAPVHTGPYRKVHAAQQGHVLQETNSHVIFFIHALSFPKIPHLSKHVLYIPREGPTSGRTCSEHRNF